MANCCDTEYVLLGEKENIISLWNDMKNALASNGNFIISKKPFYLM